MSTMTAATLSKGLRLLSAIVADEGRSSLTAIAQGLGTPLPTAHRLAMTLEEEGFLQRGRKGYFFRGPALARMDGAQDLAREAAVRLRRDLAQLALSQRAFVHFGTLEDGMVTYLVKEKGLDAALFTEERMQLEAYCSAVGKVLLAAMPAGDLEDYLANGPFVALTRNTITEPPALRAEIATVRAKGVAYDRFEIRDDLYCVAVPVRCPNGVVIGGISASLLGPEPSAGQLARLRKSLERIAAPRPPRASPRLIGPVS